MTLGLPSVNLLGLDIAMAEESELIRLMVLHAEQRRPLLLTYATAHTLERAASDRSFRESIRNADVCFADGMGVVLSARLLKGVRLRKTTANDFFYRLIASLGQSGLRVALVGGRSGVVERVARRLEAMGCRPVLAESGYFPPGDDGLLRKLGEEDPHLVVVGLGQPRQEDWAHRALRAHPRTVFLCVGGLFDLLSGEIPSPPAWVRSSGLEWSFRLVTRFPSTWRRYLLGLPRLAFLLARESLKN